MTTVTEVVQTTSPYIDSYPIAKWP